MAGAMVYPTASPIEPHAVHSERLMRRAWDSLANDNLDAASESGWGAFVQAVKAVADERCWEYLNINLVRPVVSALCEESGEPGLQSEANAAQALHINYYCDEMFPADIARDFRVVVQGLERLKGISRRYRDDAEYRARADALLPPCRAYNPRRRWEPLSPNGSAPPADTDAPDE